MIYYILGAVVASLVVLLFLKSSGTKKKGGASSMETQRIESVKESLENGKCHAEFDGSTDIIIIDVGVAGAALAHTLGMVYMSLLFLNYSLKDGRRLHVIERDLTEPDRIVGELLQPGGYLKLIWGLEDCVSQIDAQQVYGYAPDEEGRSIKLSYPLEGFHSDVSGRVFTMAFSFKG